MSRHLELPNFSNVTEVLSQDCDLIHRRAIDELGGWKAALTSHDYTLIAQIGGVEKCLWMMHQLGHTDLVEIIHADYRARHQGPRIELSNWEMP